MARSNERYLLRLWMVPLFFAGILAICFIAALTSGDAERVIPAAIGLTVAAVFFVTIRNRQKRRMARLLRSADPRPQLAEFAAAGRRVKHGPQMMAGGAATLLALYGLFDDAEQALAAVSWEDVPPLIAAQQASARAVIAYARGAYEEGLDYAVAAAQQGTVDAALPGARTSELAFRNARNVGLALAGRDTDRTAEELRTAYASLPLVGRLLAAWGLLAIARRKNAVDEAEKLRAFLRTNAPYATALQGF